MRTSKVSASETPARSFISKWMLSWQRWILSPGLTRGGVRGDATPKHAQPPKRPVHGGQSLSQKREQAPLDGIWIPAQGPVAGQGAPARTKYTALGVEGVAKSATGASTATRPVENPNTNTTTAVREMGPESIKAPDRTVGMSLASAISTAASGRTADQGESRPTWSTHPRRASSGSEPPAGGSMLTAQSPHRQIALSGDEASGVTAAV